MATTFYEVRVYDIDTLSENIALASHSTDQSFVWNYYLTLGEELKDTHMITYEVRTR
jgi:hypothetical protein